MTEKSKSNPVRSRRAKLARVALAVMVLVTAWSLWAWAQPRPQIERPTPAEVKTAEANQAAEEKAAEEHEQPLPINWVDFGKETPPYLAMVINFAILAAGYYFLGRKPIAAGLQARRDSIAKDIEEAQRMKAEAEARAKVYQVKLEKLEEEMTHAREALVRAGEAERDRMVRDAEAKAERMRRDAEFMVEQELKQIRIDLWRETVEAAVTAAEDLLKKRVTAADQERLAEDYLADLGGKKPVAPPAATGTNGAGTTGAGSAGTGTQEVVS